MAPTGSRPSLPSLAVTHYPSPVSRASRFKETLAATGSAEEGRQAGTLSCNPGVREERVVVGGGLPGLPAANKREERASPGALEAQKKGPDT